VLPEADFSCIQRATEPLYRQVISTDRCNVPGRVNAKKTRSDGSTEHAMAQVHSPDDIGLDEIQSFESFCKRYPDIANEARLRWWIFHRKSNGLAASGALVKRSGRWFVVLPRLKEWILRDDLGRAV
jgi:hypothetical protein